MSRHSATPLDGRVRIEFDRARLTELCCRWQIKELALFGSVLRDDFNPDSDVDVLLTFAPDAGWSLFDLVALQQELGQLFDRRVDLVEKGSLKNPFRRRELLSRHHMLYAA